MNHARDQLRGRVVAFYTPRTGYATGRVVRVARNRRGVLQALTVRLVSPGRQLAYRGARVRLSPDEVNRRNWPATCGLVRGRRIVPLPMEVSHRAQVSQS